MRIRKLLIAVTASLCLNAASKVPAVAASLRYEFYNFVSDGLADFSQVSSKTHTEVSAQLSGKIVIGVDGESGVLSLARIDAALHSAVLIGEGDNADALWLEGVSLRTIMPGVYDNIPGTMSFDEKFMVFGPFRSIDRNYVVHFSLFSSEGDLRLIGSAKPRFEHSPTYVINAALVAAPEPSTVMLVLFGSVLLCTRRRPSATFAGRRG